MKTRRLIYGLLFSLILLLTIESNATAATYISGPITSDTTWTLANSPYIATGSVLVMSGVILTIDPGVTVKFNSGFALQIDGTLIAMGTSGNEITFTSNQITPAPGDWGYILFSDSSTDATYDTNENYISGSILEYVVVEYAGGVSVSNNGAVRLDNAHPFINYTTVRTNSASGIYAWDLTGNLKIINSTISSNNAASSAGGMYAQGFTPWNAPQEGSITITNCLISDNVGNSGGGVFASANSITISNSTITGNTGSATSYGSSDGGGIYIAGVNAYLYGNTVTNNKTDCYGYCYGYGGFNGGGIWVGSNEATISNNTVSNNTAWASGGGIYVSGGIVTVSNNIISENTALDKSPIPTICGGGIRVSGGTVAIEKNIIANNTTQGKGGGIYVSGGTVTISSNAISDNTASLTGGGVGITGGTVSLAYNDIINNAATNASAISYCCADNQNFRYNTIIGNTATGTSPAYAVYIANNSHPLFNYNNIFNNSATYELWNDNAQGSANVNAENNWWGTTTESVILTRIYDWFDDASKGLVDYSPYSTSIRTDAPISPPAGLTATASTNPISLTWSPNPESDLAGYKVYWSTIFGFPYVNVVDVGNVTSYTITSLPAGTYYVTVTAYDTSYNPANDDPNTIVNENQTNGNESWYAEEQAVLTGVCTDNDDDAYAIEGGDCGPVDCDDTNPLINPGATEICNGIDDNCDGQIDEGGVCAPNVSVSPISNNFRKVTVGSSSSPKTFTISNTGTANLVINKLSLSGTNYTEFTLQKDTCSRKTLAPSATCTFKAVFSPTSIGIKGAKVRIPSNDPDTPMLMVPLSGEGI